MFILRRLLVGLLVAVFALIVAVTISIPVDYLINRDRVAQLTNETIPGQQASGQQRSDVAAFVARPSGEGPFPAVIMIHEFWGLRESIVGKAEALAEQGYVVVAPDLFRGRSTAWIPTAIYQTLSAPQERVNTDLDTVYAWLGGQDDVIVERTGVMGFCFGGGMSLRYSLHNGDIAATAIFYGSPIVEAERLRSLPAPVLGVFGAEDASISLEQVQAFDDALGRAEVPHEIQIYQGVGHAFVTGVDAVQAGGAPGQAWQELLGFLSRHLQSVEREASL